MLPTQQDVKDEVVVIEKQSPLLHGKKDVTKPEVLALFAGIYKSNAFTVEAAHKAFGCLARKEDCIKTAES